MNFRFKGLKIGSLIITTEKELKSTIIELNADDILEMSYKFKKEAKR